MAVRSRVFLLLALFATALASDEGAETCATQQDADGRDGKCAAAHGCHRAGTCEDAIAKDIEKLCPLAYLPISRGLVRGALRLLPALKPLLAALQLWPSEVEPEAFSDDYFFAVYVIISRVLLGLYSTRTKAYVNIPWLMQDVNDVIQLENVRSPHTDVDGAPNFYSFEFLVPQPVLRRVFVPLYTCFYGVMRDLAIDSGSGDFDDALNDTTVNTWEAVLKPGQSMKDWVASFYEHAHTLDGFSLWPRQMTDFSFYFKKDEWVDQLEYAIAFDLIGTHRLESGSWTFKDVAGFETTTLPFRLPLNQFSGIAVRPGFGRFGVDLYFNADGLPVLLETPDKQLVARGDPAWQYWKFVWRSTLVTGITLVDHLHMTHYRAATLLSRAVRVSFAPDHPMRRILSIFTFGSIFVNAQAMHTLLGPNHLLHRATPFKDFSSLSTSVPETMDDITAVPAIKALLQDSEWDKLDAKLKATPFYADGRLLVGAFRKLVARFLDLVWPLSCLADGKFSPNMLNFTEDMYRFTTEGHYKMPSNFGVTLPPFLRGVSCHGLRPFMTERLLAFLYIVTAWHRQVGFVGDYYGDPSLTSMSWKDGEAYGRPRQHMIMSVINVFTSTRQPLLKEDYTHLFKGVQFGLEADLTQLWRDFQKDLQEVEAEINRRNEGREIKNINHSPEVLECSVAK